MNRFSLANASVLVGIDDTDNLDSRGTGRLARMLVDVLAQAGVGEPLAATRHQLLVDDRIRYTSHNSSACIALDAGPAPDLEAIIEVASSFLETESALGSDPGLAVVPVPAEHGPALAEFGRRAQREVLDQRAARAIADATGVHLSAHGGDGGGIIGSLCAVGLHGEGEDGRFLWMPGLRSVSGQWRYGDLLTEVPLGAALDPSGAEPGADEIIDLGDWVRPVLRGGRAVLLLDDRPASGPWTVLGREVVKSY